MEINEQMLVPILSCLTGQTVHHRRPLHEWYENMDEDLKLPLGVLPLQFGSYKVESLVKR